MATNKIDSKTNVRPTARGPTPKKTSSLEQSQALFSQGKSGQPIGHKGGGYSIDSANMFNNTFNFGFVGVK